jgi:hypothetical protein
VTLAEQLLWQGTKGRCSPSFVLPDTNKKLIASAKPLGQSRTGFLVKGNPYPAAYSLLEFELIGICFQKSAALMPADYNAADLIPGEGIDRS